jgi:hypothetical protein
LNPRRIPPHPGQPADRPSPTQATRSAAPTATAPAPAPPAVRYGATITCRDAGTLFLSCYGTTGPGQPHPDPPYRPLSHI